MFFLTGRRLVHLEITTFQLVQVSTRLFLLMILQMVTHSQEHIARMMQKIRLLLHSLLRQTRILLLMFPQYGAMVQLSQTGMMIQHAQFLVVRLHLIQVITAQYFSKSHRALRARLSLSISTKIMAKFSRLRQWQVLSVNLTQFLLMLSLQKHMTL